MVFQVDGIVKGNERIKPSHFLLTIYCPQIAHEIKAGQFIMLKASNIHSPFLRRPFSIYKKYPIGHPDREKRGCLVILYKNIGKGTQKMTEFREGQKINIIGPLGNTFSLPSLPSSSPTILIGGGVGIVSLYSLAELLKSHKLIVFIGGKTKDDILCEDDFKELASNVFIATEDGSKGYKGTVIDLFLSQKRKVRGSKPRYLYSCGPTEMLKELTNVIRFKKFIGQASLEARMGCGFGACWGCVIRTNDSKMLYKRVCKEGPVFNLEDIAWENNGFHSKT